MAFQGKALAGLACVVLIVAGPAAATQSESAKTSTQSPNTVSGVTVTAPQKPSALVDPTSQFVREHLPQSQNEQYSRFRDDVCVKVQGLPTEFNTFIAKRIVEVALQVRAPVSKAADCTANINVIFTPDPQRQLADIAKRRDILFGYYLKAQVKKVTTFNRPIQSWYLTRATGTDGFNALEINSPNQCISSYAPGSAPCDIAAPPVTGRPGSRLGNDMSSELVHSLILADSTRVSGQPIGAIADYVAVLALSRWQSLERCNKIATILNLMADDCSDDAPQSATQSDLALLSALYAVDPRESGAQQRISIADRMSQGPTDPNKPQH